MRLGEAQTCVFDIRFDALVSHSRAKHAQLQYTARLEDAENRFPKSAGVGVEIHGLDVVVFAFLSPCHTYCLASNVHSTN